MPTPEESDVISEEIYQQTGFPFVQGVVDGTHIEITKPFGIVNFLPTNTITKNTLV